MKNRSGLLILAALSAISMGSNNHDNKTYIDEEPVKHKSKIIPNGCQVFNINGIDIMALNYKNALKKYNKLNYEKSR